MKDLHSHILYGIDDGVRTREESIKILKKASKNGVTDIVLTPHYINNSIYNANNVEKMKRLQVLQEDLQKEKIDINLYLGNEVYIDENIVSLLKTEITTINSSRYILLELPLNSKSFILDEVLFYLKQENLTPIIAHPERYLSYYNDYDFFEDLLKKGCLFQADIGSLYGVYGIKSKKMVKGLLKRNLIHFFGSDVHSGSSNVYDKKIAKDLLKIVKSKEKVDDLLNNNVDRVLKNEEIN